GIRFVGDLDVEVKAVLVLFAEQPASDPPAVARHIIDRDGRNFALLAKNPAGQVQQHFRHLPARLRVFLGADLHIQNGHDRLLLVSYTTIWAKKSIRVSNVPSSRQPPFPRTARYSSPSSGVASPRRWRRRVPHA